MPLGVHELHIAQHALVDHLLDSLIILAIAPLQADLQNLLGMLRGINRTQFLNFVGREYEALFTENVLAGLQRILEHRIVKVNRVSQSVTDSTELSARSCR